MEKSQNKLSKSYKIDILPLLYYNVIQMGGDNMAMITVRVSDAEKEWLSYMAEFYGITLSELLKTYSMEQLEDEYNRQTAEIAHKHWVESGKTTVSMEEILHEFGGLE